MAGNCASQCPMIQLCAPDHGLRDVIERTSPAIEQRDFAIPQRIIHQFAEY